MFDKIKQAVDDKAVLDWIQLSELECVADELDQHWQVSNNSLLVDHQGGTRLNGIHVREFTATMQIEYID